MLKELHIKNVVLIKSISIDFISGFSVFTGETGAGKSILLDSLALALGERANYSLIRKGENIAEITAVFSVKNHPVQYLLQENVILQEDNLVLRRVISVDGKTKAFVNNVSVSINFLRQVGSMLLDIHGQFDNQRLLNPAFHIDILDAFLENKTIITSVVKAYEDYKNIEKDYDDKKIEIQRISKEKEYIEYFLEELEELNPQVGEEKELHEQKIILNNAQKINNTLDNIEKSLSVDTVLSSINKSLKILENSRSILNKDIKVDKVVNTLETAYSSFLEGVEYFNSLKVNNGFEDKDLPLIEERLMNLRTVAKKHKINPDDLPNLISEFKDTLNTINISSYLLTEIEKELEHKKEIFNSKARSLTEARRSVAKIIENKINNELLFLKLYNAEFKVSIEGTSMNFKGKDKVIFKVKTNIGTDFGDLNKVASGGEIARFMLALKIILAEVDTISTIILDEIDIGVGGEVAEAIGKRLLYLARSMQTIVVTHSHQVASKGQHHYKVIKTIMPDASVETFLTQLNNTERIEEVARMLSGSIITNEARATAMNLLKLG